MELYTPAQKQVVSEKTCNFGKFFARKKFINNWTQNTKNKFINDFPKKDFTKKAYQLGVLFAYYITIQNIDYFKKNRTFDFSQYFTNSPTTSWAGFAYDIFQSLQELKTDDEVQCFFETLYNIIFD